MEAPVAPSSANVCVGGCGPGTAIAALLALSAPLQLSPTVGVTEYLQSPAGTLASVQLVAGIVPAQLERIV